MRRIALGLLMVALFVCHATGVSAQGFDAARWLAQNTDLRPAQVAIVSRDAIYAVEPFGPQTATGEVIAHVTTEAVAPDWRAHHDFLSWEAHVIFDCNGRRMRVIRSASYPDHGERGQPHADVADAAWRTPSPAEPGAQLLAAACDPTFDWPMRRASAQAPAPAAHAPLLGADLGAQFRPKVEAAAPTVVAAQPTASTIVFSPPVAPKLTAAAYAVQVARGPYEDGAQRALDRAQELLDADFGKLIASTEPSLAGTERRYTAILTGFTDADAAEQACETLRAAGQLCNLRRAPSRTADPSDLRLAWSDGRLYTVQLARGPDEDGAQRAILRARSILDPNFAGLSADTVRAGLGDDRRYTAILTGFESAAAAAWACDMLHAAGQDCQLRTVPVDRLPAAAGLQAAVLRTSRRSGFARTSRGPPSQRI
jgi:hypothetical protein